MFEVLIQRGVFVKALSHVQSVVERKNISGIASHLKIDAADNRLVITAIDTGLSITETIDANVIKEGSLTLPAYTLYEIVRKFSEETINRLRIAAIRQFENPENRQKMVGNKNGLGGKASRGQIAWNKGISIDQKFNLFKNSATLGLDFFRNDFDNQVIVDLENARSVQFYNLKGKSYSNSFQAELNITPIKKLDVRMAYRYFDVKQSYNGILLDRPFIAKNRAFLSIDYAAENAWKFNYTVTYNGKKRIVNTTANPSLFQLDPYSPSFILMNAQVSKTFGKKHPMDVYLGSENISNIMQKNTILSANNPFSPYFDASMVWGPTTGRMLYMGWRMKIK
jgi:hypothetical protein